MSLRLVPLKRGDLIARLKRLGFEGPFAGGKHEFLVRGSIRLTLPNRHQSDIATGLLARILQQAGVAREDWERTA